MRQRSLSQAGRAVEKDMIQGFSPEFGRLDIDVQVGDNLPLPGEITELLRADNSVKFTIFAVCWVMDDALFNSDTNIVFIFKN